MTMQPSLSEEYYQDSINYSIKQRMDDSYNQGLTINQVFWNEADIDMRFKTGDQELYNELYGNLPGYQRKSFNFNRIRRIINMITGHQRKNRKSMTVIPVENSDEYTSNQLSKLLIWSTGADNVLETISEAFEGACTTGMNLLNVWMDYRKDTVNGDLRVDNVSYNGYLIDPYFRKTDLSDCNFLWRRQWKSKIQLKALFPGRDDDIDKLQIRGNKDGRFQYMVETYSYGMENLAPLDEYWYLDTREQLMLQDVDTGDTMEWHQDMDELHDFMSQAKRAGKNFVTSKFWTPTVKLAYVIDGNVFYDGPNPNGHKNFPIDRYPFVPVLGYYEPDVPYFPNRVQGVVRGLRDAQFLYNRRKIIELDILESQINSGWIYKQDSLIDPNDVFFSGQGKGLALKQDAQMTDVQRIDPPGIPGSMIQLSQMLGEEIMQISGVNEELLGSAVDDKAGILSMLRQGAGLTTLQKLFDQLDLSQKLLGSIMVEMIQANFRPGKVKRITEQEASPQFKNKTFQKYDCEIEDGLNTTTQRQNQFATMFYLQQAGLPITSKMLMEASTLQNKSEIIEQLDAAEQATQQQAQKQEAMQLQVMQAQLEDLKARAAANQGLGIERISRIEENMELAKERRASAISELEQASLDKVRAMKELQSMDLAELESLLRINEMLKQQSIEQVEKAQLPQEEVQPGVERLQPFQEAAIKPGP